MNKFYKGAKMLKNIILFIITTSLLVFGQAFWKVAAGQISGTFGVVNIGVKLLFNFPFICGCLFYIIATGLWIYLLGQYEYSRIYPVFVGACIILSILAGYILFKETNHLVYKVIGSIVILLGIFITLK